MNLSWREASDADIDLLAEWNHQLIRDEGHGNSMRVEELAARMKKWLGHEYRAVIFEAEVPVAYALFKMEEQSIYLRQLFVRRDRRSRGVGRAAFEILREQVWPRELRLTVEVLCGNPRAIAFYKSVGYREYCLTMEIPSR